MSNPETKDDRYVKCQSLILSEKVAFLTNWQSGQQAHPKIE